MSAITGYFGYTRHQISIIQYTQKLRDISGKRLYYTFLQSFHLSFRGLRKSITIFGIHQMELRVKKVQNQLIKGQRPYQMKTQDTWHTQNYPVEYFNTRRRSVEQECKGKLLRKQDNVACSTNEIGSKTTLEEQNIFNAVGIASNDKSNTFIGLKHDQKSIIVQIFEIVTKKKVCSSTT